MISPRPSAHRDFQAAYFGVGAAFDELSPAGGDAAAIRCHLVEPFCFAFFPASKHFGDQVLAVTEMPIEAAFADGEVACEDFDADSVNPFGGKARETGKDPIVWMKRDGFDGRGASHTVAYVREKDNLLTG
jgi:hypothetical protein